MEKLKISVLVQNKGQIEGLPANPRAIRGEKFERLKKNLEKYPEFLDRRPLVVIPHGGKYVVIGGNQRLTAAKSLGWKEIPCTVLPEDVPVERLKAYAVIDNNNFGEWDWDMLANEWDNSDLAEWGVDMEWMTDGVQKEAEEDGMTDEDMEKVPTRCQAGQLWRLGNHRLLCGNSADPDAVARLMDGEKADMVFTDPPYGVAIGSKNKEMKKYIPYCQNMIEKDIANDDIPLAGLYPILVKAMTNCRENCNEDAVYYVTVPYSGALHFMMLQMMEEAGLPVRHTLVWLKNYATFSLGWLDYDYKTEAIFYTWTKRHHNYRGGDFRTNVWEIDKVQHCNQHPTMKPVALVANALKDGSKEGDIVLDMFGGSGTTLIAAEQLGRRARLMELDSHYCDVIIARWEELTGQTAEAIG